MSVDRDISGLSHSELVALVYQLRQQIKQQEQEIAQLKGQQKDEAATTEQLTNDTPPQGSHEDLLEQLNKLYPAG
jgi:cell division protein FtsB